MWVDDENKIIEAFKELGIEATEKKLRGITALEKELKKANCGAGEIMRSLTVSSTPPLTLVPESDPRPAIQGAKDLLDALPVG